MRRVCCLHAQAASYEAVVRIIITTCTPGKWSISTARHVLLFVLVRCAAAAAAAA